MSTKQTIDRDYNLALRLTRGDEEAFCELYAAYKSRLIYFAMRFVKSQEFAEDIFQDAFAVIWQSRNFINPESFSSYLYTIVRNRIFNLLREFENEEKFRNHVLSQAVDFDDHTCNSLLAGELQEILLKAMNGLTPRQREVFELSRNGLLSHKEIAEKLGISLYTVQEHITESLKSIRAYLKKYGSYADLLLLLLCLNS